MDGPDPQLGLDAGRASTGSSGSSSVALEPSDAALLATGAPATAAALGLLVLLVGTGLRRVRRR